MLNTVPFTRSFENQFFFCLFFSCAVLEALHIVVSSMNLNMADLNTKFSSFKGLNSSATV